MIKKLLFILLILLFSTDCNATGIFGNNVPLFGSGADGSLTTTKIHWLTPTGHDRIVKNYTDLTITTGTTLTSNTRCAGMLLLVNGTFTMSGGYICMNGKGYAASTADAGYIRFIMDTTPIVKSEFWDQMSTNYVKVKGGNGGAGGLGGRTAVDQNYIIGGARGLGGITGGGCGGGGAAGGGITGNVQNYGSAATANDGGDGATSFADKQGSGGGGAGGGAGGAATGGGGAGANSTGYPGGAIVIIAKNVVLTSGFLFADATGVGGKGSASGGAGGAAQVGSNGGGGGGGGGAGGGLIVLLYRNITSGAWSNITKSFYPSGYGVGGAGDGTGFSGTNGWDGSAGEAACVQIKN